MVAPVSQRSSASLSKSSLSPAGIRPPAATGTIGRSALALACLAGLGLIAHIDFLAFHLVAELATVVVSFMVFAVAAGSYRFHHNAYLLLLGGAYFWVGLLDLAHALTYRGMGLFGVTTANLATQMWLSARVIETVALVAAPWFLSRRQPLSLYKVVAIFGWLSAALLGCTLGGLMPDAYIDGTGLTSFKVVIEWCLVAGLLVSMIELMRKRALLPRPSYAPLLCAIALTIATELLFTLYTGVSGTINTLGHMTKFVSFWLVLEALVSTTLTQPFEMIARTSSTYDCIPIPTLVVNGQGRIIQVNQTTCDWLDMPLDQIIGDTFLGLLNINPTLAQSRRITAAFESTTPLADEEIVDTVRGRTILMSAAPPGSSTGSDDTVMVVSLRDTSTHKALNRNLEIARSRVDIALLNSGQGLWDWGIRTNEIYFSPAIETMLGYQPGTWQNTLADWQDRIHPDDLPRVMYDLQRHLDGTSDRYDNTHRLRHRAGHWVWIHDQGRVVERDADGRPTRAVGTHTELAEETGELP